MVKAVVEEEHIQKVNDVGIPRYKDTRGRYGFLGSLLLDCIAHCWSTVCQNSYFDVGLAMLSRMSNKTIPATEAHVS